MRNLQQSLNWTWKELKIKWETLLTLEPVYRMSGDHVIITRVFPKAIIRAINPIMSKSVRWQSRSRITHKRKILRVRRSGNQKPGKEQAKAGTDKKTGNLPEQRPKKQVENRRGQSGVVHKQPGGEWERKRDLICICLKVEHLKWLHGKFVNPVKSADYIDDTQTI